MVFGHGQARCDSSAWPSGSHVVTTGRLVWASGTMLSPENLRATQSSDTFFDPWYAFRAIDGNVDTDPDNNGCAVTEDQSSERAKSWCAGCRGCRSLVCICADLWILPERSPARWTFCPTRIAAVRAFLRQEWGQKPISTPARHVILTLTSQVATGPGPSLRHQCAGSADSLGRRCTILAHQVEGTSQISKPGLGNAGNS